MKGIFRYGRKAARRLEIFVVVLLLAYNLYFIVMVHLAGVSHPTVFGYSGAVIVSGSMAPALSPGDLILNYEQSSYEEGDIITFCSGDILITHRIAAVTENGYITQGDANNTADPDPVLPESVVGRVVGVIPHIGRGVVLLKTPVGTMVLILSGIFLIGSSFFFQVRRDHVDEGGSNEQ